MRNNEIWVFALPHLFDVEVFLCRLHHSDTSRVLSLFYRFILQYIGKREVRNGPSIPACTPWKETECAGDFLLVNRI